MLKAGFLSDLVAIGKQSLQFCSGEGGEPKAAKCLRSLSINEKIDPMFVVKDSIICTSSRFYKHKKYFFYFIADHRILFRRHKINIIMLHGFDGKNKQDTL